MTSEELIILLDGLQTRLPKCANQVLLHLVAKCIRSGSNEVATSEAQIARDLGMSRDAVKVAKRALRGIVETHGGEGNATTWILPVEWFALQRSLFAVNSPVDKWPNLPGNQAPLPGNQAGHLPGNQAGPDEKPGRTCLETRQGWTSFQAGGCLETRQVSPETKDLSQSTCLETRQPSIDRVEYCGFTGTVLRLRDSIEGVNWLPDEKRTHGEILKRWLRDYFAQTRPHQPVPDGPDEIILAKCLALASLDRLDNVLQKLAEQKIQCKESWAWFVTVFCQRIYGTKDTKQVPAEPAFRQAKKNPSSERRPEFTTDLLDELTSATKKLQ